MYKGNIHAPKHAKLIYENATAPVFSLISNGGFSWNLNLSAVWDEDLGYLCFEHVRLDFSTHGEVPLVRGKFLPNAFYKEICQIFIPDTFFIFFSNFHFFRQNVIVLYVSAIYCMVLTLFLTHF